jgi:hypothetical protein
MAGCEDANRSRLLVRYDRGHRLTIQLRLGGPKVSVAGTAGDLGGANYGA